MQVSLGVELEEDEGSRYLQLGYHRCVSGFWTDHELTANHHDRSWRFHHKNLEFSRPVNNWSPKAFDYRMFHFAHEVYLYND